MKTFKEHEKSKAICDNCGPVSTTFKFRDVPMSDSGKIIKNILVGVCDTCGATVSVPQQEAINIKKQND